MLVLPWQRVQRALTGFKKADLQGCCDRDYFVSSTVPSHLSNSNNDQVFFLSTDKLLGSNLGK